MAAGYHDRFRKLIEEVRPHIETIATKRLSEEMEQESDQPTLIDIREHDEWSSSHIPHSQSIPKSIIERDIEFHVPNLNKKIVVYSREGYLSLLAAENLIRMEYTNVYSLKGGYHAWTIAGLPIQQGGKIVFPDKIEASDDLEESSMDQESNMQQTDD